MGELNPAYLKQLLRNAVEREDYEQAAMLRDRIKVMEEALAGMQVNASGGGALQPKGKEEQRRTHDLEDSLGRPSILAYTGPVQYGGDLQRSGDAAWRSAEKLREALLRSQAEVERLLLVQLATYFPDVPQSLHSFRREGFVLTCHRVHHEEYHFRGRLLLVRDFSTLPPVITVPGQSPNTLG